MWRDKVRSDAVLKLFDTLMKRKHQRKLSGSYEVKAYKEEAQLLKEHYEFASTCEKRVNE